MKARILILTAVLFISKVTFAHPIHVSVVTIDHAIDSNRIDMSVRLYYDDFQLLINNKFNLSLDFGKRTRLTTSEQQAITDYIKSALVLTDQNENRISPDFNGWKVEDMSVWLYFCANTDLGINVARLKNTLMLDLFNDQKNLVITQVKGNEKGYEFDKRIVEQQLSL